MTVKRPTRRSLNVSPFPEITEPPPTPDDVKHAALLTLADRDALDLVRALGLEHMLKGNAT